MYIPTDEEISKKLPEIELSQEQQKAEMQELIKMIEKKKGKGKAAPVKKVREILFFLIICLRNRFVRV